MFSALNCLRVITTVLLVAGISEGQNVFVLDGIELPPAQPRNAHSMAYNRDDGKVYVFGGADEKQVLADLRFLDGNGWTGIDSEGPAARTFASFAYAGPGYGLLLFGGNNVLFGNDSNPARMLGDTWQFKNGKWSKLETEAAPSPRAEAAVAYDPRRRSVVLFGGYSIVNGSVRKLGDTWEFRNGRWKKLSDTGPSARNGASIAWDEQRNAIVLFGGSTIDRKYGIGTGETWILRNNRWQELNTHKPPNAFNAVMTFYGVSGSLVRFGGWNGNRRTDEMWELRRNGWIRIGGAAPAARNHAAMVFDRKNKRLVLYGGHDGEYIFGDTWEFTGRKWSVLADGFRPKRIDNGH